MRVRVGRYRFDVKTETAIALARMMKTKARRIEKEVGELRRLAAQVLDELDSDTERKDTEHDHEDEAEGSGHVHGAVVA